MGNELFGEKKTTKQIIREQKRINNRSIRELDRSLNKMKQQEKKEQIEMKRLAKQGQMAAIKATAKNIVRMRQHQNKIVKLRCELRSVSHQMDSMQANAQLMKAMKNVSQIMPQINKQMQLPELQKVMQQYDQEQMNMQIKQEMVDDAMEMALDHDSDDENELIQQVLDEIGIEVDQGLDDAPKNKLKADEQMALDNADKDLQNRLNALSS
eukprot:302729_1